MTTTEVRHEFPGAYTPKEPMRRISGELGLLELDTILAGEIPFKVYFYFSAHGLVNVELKSSRSLSEKEFRLATSILEEALSTKYGVAQSTDFRGIRIRKWISGQTIIQIGSYFLPDAEGITIAYTSRVHLAAEQL
jgi:hypothetical protein